MKAAIRIGGAVFGLLIGVLAVLALREATESRHEPSVPGTRTEFVVRASNRGGEHRQTVQEMVESIVLSCRLEVTSDLDGPVVPVGDERFRVALTPALDPTNRRQFRGCVEDWTLDHVLLDIETIEAIESRR
jgi:hypothetical protein